MILRFILYSSFTSTDFFISTFFFFNDTATTEIYTLSLHDALPIYFFMFVQGHWLLNPLTVIFHPRPMFCGQADGQPIEPRDRKSTRLNSSHSQISYAVFCLKKKKIKNPRTSNDHIKAKDKQVNNQI